MKTTIPSSAAARRSAAAAITAALVGASVLFLGTASASALPAGFSIAVGTVTENTFGNTMTLTQTSAVAVVDFSSFAIASGETLTIVQPDEDALLIIRNAGALAVIEGSITANASVIISSPTGVGIAANGIVSAGVNAIFTTGAITNAGAGLDPVPIDPNASDGQIIMIEGSQLTGGRSAGIAGDVVIMSGSLTALNGFAMLYSVDSTSYGRDSTPTLLPGAGYLDDVIVADPGNVTATGGLLILASQGLVGSLVAYPNDAIDGAQVLLLGPGLGEPLDVSAFASQTDPVGSTLGARAITASDVLTSEFDSALLIVEGTPVPDYARVSLSNFVVENALAFDEVDVECGTDDGLSAAVSILNPNIASIPIVPADYDFNIPNQAPIPFGEAGGIQFNVQEYRTVGGYEVLTTTAVRLLDDEGFRIDIGIVDCALPAAALLAATGSSMDDTAPVAVGAGLLSLIGLVLVLRRRRSSTAR